ncbi:MAG TPA: hypothetical protein VJP79_11740 [Nitrososphaera sp.]|nr:hypothetical protein [Nitrososphaera sp.]
MTFNCHGCNSPIKFDNNVKSASGKVIPLNPDGSHHECPAKQQIASTPRPVQQPEPRKDEPHSMSLISLDRQCVDAAQGIIAILNNLAPYSKMTIAIEQRKDQLATA